eukprot:3234699-Prymnesium_polylepis.1
MDPSPAVDSACPPQSLAGERCRSPVLGVSLVLSSVPCAAACVDNGVSPAGTWPRWRTLCVVVAWPSP